MAIVLNLTQHQSTADQKEASVVEPENKEAIKRNLDFDEIPSTTEISARATALAELAAAELDARGVAEDQRCAMVGGAPFFMSDLELALRERGITPLYAFSKRAVTEVQREDGTVEKKVIFKHQGFVEGRAHLRNGHLDQHATRNDRIPVPEPGQSNADFHESLRQARDSARRSLRGHDPRPNLGKEDETGRDGHQEGRHELGRTSADPR